MANPHLEQTDFLGFAKGTVAVVTGVASGIGRETAAQLLAQGLRVVGLDINAAGLATLDFGPNFSGRVLDTGNRADVEAMFATLKEEYGEIAHLVNNAGPPSSAPYSIEEGMAKTAGSVEAVTAAWEASGLPAGASVVNVASVAGTISGGPPPAIVRERARGKIGNGWYGAGKAAIAGLTRYQAVFAAGRFRANAVAPGVIATPRVADLTGGAYGRLMVERCPLGRLGEALDVARAIVFLLSPAASYVNGVTLVIDGGGTLVF
ncbi:MAG: SDR family oxidoreductase [Rhizomicrobium sp.]